MREEARIHALARNLKTNADRTRSRIADRKDGSHSQKDNNLDFLYYPRPMYGGHRLVLTAEQRLCIARPGAAAEYDDAPRPILNEDAGVSP